ncbi:hypothetical protein EQG41_08930 [Billgrantia azerbaijanica]|nr:hypothetical protein EQG41_08930 [Halomonas azerbaijanica]
MSELERLVNQLLLVDAILAMVGLAIVIFVLWCLYVYVASKRDWLEEDIKIRRSEKIHNLARAEQIRLESLALKDRLEKSGIKDKAIDVEKV